MPRPAQAKRRLKLRQLEILSAVAESGTMGKAAQRLAVSQPVVSKAIADLERTLGVQLLDRGQRGAEPTLYGRALLRRSLAIFDEINQSVNEIDFLADPTAGELHIGCTETITAGLVAAAIERLSRRHPKLVFHMELADVATLRQHFLRERKCELIIGRMVSAAAEPDMETEALFNERPMVVVGPGNKWLGRRKIALAQLVDEPWILSSSESLPGAPLFEAYRAIKLSLPRATIISNSLGLRRKLLPGGGFVTLVPESVLRFGPEPSFFRPLSVSLPSAPLPVAVVTLKNRTLSAVAQLFIDCVRELAKPLANRKKPPAKQDAMSPVGPTRTSRDVRFSAAVGGIADVPQTSQKRRS